MTELHNMVLNPLNEMFRWLQKIMDRDIYKKDYENITAKILFEDVLYGTAGKTLQKIVDYKLFNDKR